MGNGATVQRKREVVIVQHMANMAAQMQAERDAHQAKKRQLDAQMHAERDAHQARERQLAAQMQAERDAHQARERQSIRRHAQQAARQAEQAARQAQQVANEAVVKAKQVARQTEQVARQAEQATQAEEIAAQQAEENDAQKQSIKRPEAQATRRAAQEAEQAIRTAKQVARQAKQAARQTEEKAAQTKMAPLQAAEHQRVDRQLKQLLKGDLKSNEEQTQTAKRSVEQRNTSADGNFDVIKSAEERTTCSKLPTYHDFTLIKKKDFLKSFKWMLKRAKAQGIDVVGQTFKIANFAAAILDCHGGCLSIDDLDVRLCVPPGAIPEGQTQQVYIFVTGTSSVDKHSFSTPIVHCGPPDHVFNKDVVLTMPHCIKNATSCKFSLSKLSSGGSCDELCEGLDVTTVVDDNSIKFSVNHFCGFAATASPLDGTILKKSMVACVFIRECSDDEIQLRLQLVDDVKVNLDEVNRKEERYGFHSADTAKILVVWKNDQAVVATISHCIENWKISEPESCKREIPREVLWRETMASCAQVCPSVFFVVKRFSGSKTVPFRAHLTVYQEGSESCGHRVTFLVDARKELRLPLVSDQYTQTKQVHQTLIDQMLHLREFNSFNSRPIFMELCELLDIPNGVENDWRRLLTILFETDSGGCSVSIDGIRDKAGREQRSPTKIVVEKLFLRQSGKTEEETVATLKEALFAIDRADVEQLANRID